jgi:DNA-binding response OmpR family regulator
MRILLAEDDRKTASFVRKALQSEGFLVDVVHEGQEVVPMVSSESFDVLVLDIMLPGRDGLSVVRSIRHNGSALPVLLLTARGEITERVEGLNAGADDYLPKPFALAELVARVRALSRRAVECQPVLLRVTDLVLDTIQRTARRGEKLIELSTREFRLLEFLMRSPGRVCGRMEIVQNVWEYDFDPGTNLVDVYIMRLREKIDFGFSIKLLHTVRGVGYSLRETS